MYFEIRKKEGKSTYELWNQKKKPKVYMNYEIRKNKAKSTYELWN